MPDTRTCDLSRKLTDEALDDLRDAFARGASPADLEVEYGVSRRPVRRLVAGVEREPPALQVTSTVEEALSVFLENRAPPLTASER
jgi:hypothetical protein